MNSARLAALAIVFYFTFALHGSTLTVAVRSHSTLIEENGERRSAYAVFTDEHVLADVQLDVFKLSELPSTAAGHGELRQLRAETWLERVRWTLVSGDETQLEVPKGRLVASSLRDRGPNAKLPRDRDTTVDCRTYRVTLDFGPLPAGEYTLSGTIEGISSMYRFDVRTGQEPEWRDIHLHNKAIHAKTYDEYRRFTLERLRNDDNRLDVLLDLIDRSLEYGTLEETRSYVGRATQIVDRRERAGGGKSDSLLAREYLRRFERELPEYFAHRAEWKMVRDTTTGHHVIRSRATGKVIRDLGERNR